MKTPNPPAENPGGPTYTPGLRTPKRIMLIVGVLLLVFGGSQLWTPLFLTLNGARAKAEATRVVKEKAGFAPIIITTDAELRAQLEPRDRSFIFWNEFEFTTAEGKKIAVRANTGSQLKPLYPLTGPDGLPTTDLVCYDPSSPERAIFPLVISTWLAAVIIFAAGLATAIIGGAMLYWANKPIELPRVASSPVVPKDGTKN
jgi:hypothetical protein